MRLLSSGMIGNEAAKHKNNGKCGSKHKNNDKMM